MLAGPAQRLLRVAPAVSRWSAAQQIGHAVGVNVATFADIAAALAGAPRRTTEDGPTAAGAGILALGAIPRGVAESPSRFRPDPQPDLAALAQLVASHRSALAGLRGSAAAIAACPVRMPHFALGGMTAAEWTRFCRIHLAHHLAIADEALA